ncbi:REP15 protein, partial [Polypterus senegalus]|nr:REP15 protein [Polypterus senegalus]
MGLNQVTLLQPDDKLDTVFEVFAQAVLHASDKLKDYLGFSDPEQKLHISTRTMSTVLLMNFIKFCKEKGVEECISTCIMSRQQELTMGVDWIWTLSGTTTNVRFQIAVQAIQLTGAHQPTEMDEDPYEKRLERSILDLDPRQTTRLEKLLDFCSSIGGNCLGLCIVYGVPGRPRDIRGVLTKHLGATTEKGASLTEATVLHYLENTESFISTKEMIEKHLYRQRGAVDNQPVYIQFL